MFWAAFAFSAELRLRYADFSLASDVLLEVGKTTKLLKALSMFGEGFAGKGLCFPVGLVEQCTGTFRIQRVVGCSLDVDILQNIVVFCVEDIEG